MLNDDIESVRKTLQDGITKGYWTLEQLDREPPGLQLIKNEVRRHRVVELRDHEFPPFRNLLRDHHPETVQLTDPRDFTPASDPQPDVRPVASQVQVAGEEDPLFGDGDLFL